MILLVMLVAEIRLTSLVWRIYHYLQGLGYIPVGAGYLPSTVGQGSSNLREFLCNFWEYQTSNFMQIYGDLEGISQFDSLFLGWVA